MIPSKGRSASAPPFRYGSLVQRLQFGIGAATLTGGLVQDRTATFGGRQGSRVLEDPVLIGSVVFDSPYEVPSHLGPATTGCPASTLHPKESSGKLTDGSTVTLHEGTLEVFASSTAQVAQTQVFVLVMRVYLVDGTSGLDSGSGSLAA
jgi:hypothetical protein